uniref:hypothetical protein n=1 Tax=Candidatus Enterovibrio escicola TaxID=1927127 RepID=UPI001CC2329B|nr:hypothetical protein [Candidatus Enterovibrio escacola]
MQGVLVPFCSYLTHRQGLPSLIRPRHRFITPYAFSSISFLKVPRSEEKERWGVYTEIKVIYLIHWIGNLQIRE